jgi:hypothetical protein
MIFKSNGPASSVTQRDAMPRVLSRIIPIIMEAEHSGKHGQVMNGLRAFCRVILLHCLVSELAIRPSLAYPSLMAMHIERH